MHLIILPGFEGPASFAVVRLIDAPTLHPGLRVYRQVGAFGKIQSQQAVGVVVGTPLSRTLLLTQVDLDIGGRC